MNTSEFKKITWSIHLILGIILTILVYFIYQQLSTPAETIQDFENKEPVVNENAKAFIRSVSRAEVEKEFGWKEPNVINDTIKEKKDIAISEEIAPKIQNINDVFSLDVILGKVAFIYIKKDNQLKSFVKGEEIIDNKGEILGELKEIYAESVLILFKGKIEELKMVNESIHDVFNLSSSGETVKTIVDGLASREKTINSSLKNNLPSLEIDSTIKSKANEDLVMIDNQKIFSEDIVDRQITIEAIKKEGGYNIFFFKQGGHYISESVTVISRGSSPNITYRVAESIKGILLKNIKNSKVNERIKPFALYFTLEDSNRPDTIIALNGQNLSDKTEDELNIIYQQFADNSKDATIKVLIKDGGSFLVQIYSFPAILKSEEK